MLFLHLYRFVSLLASPFLRGYLSWRAGQGKEEAHRLRERLGNPSSVRKAGKLIWLHGVSVGESLSLLSFIHHLARVYPQVHILLTTGTVAAAHVIQGKLPKNATHNYMPLDVYSWMERFLNHWKPDVIVITESEIWPNLLQLCKKRNLPVYLINARLTERSFKKWQCIPKLSQKVFGIFTKILAQSEEVARRLRFFAPCSVDIMPNLKFAARPLPYHQEDFDAIHACMGNRPSFVAASTHQGEEKIILGAFKKILMVHPRALLFLVPRHPKRGSDIADLLDKASMRYARRSKKELPSDFQSIYLVDTLGELGLVYALSPLVLMCGSLIPGIGGHNPIEPAQMGCCVLWGPYMKNAEDICAVMAPQSLEITPENMAETVIHLLDHPEFVKEKGQLLYECVSSQKDSLKELVRMCEPHLGPSL